MIGGHGTTFLSTVTIRNTREDRRRVQRRDGLSKYYAYGRLSSGGAHRESQLSSLVEGVGLGERGATWTLLDEQTSRPAGPQARICITRSPSSPRSARSVPGSRSPNCEPKCRQSGRRDELFRDGQSRADRSTSRRFHEARPGLVRRDVVRGVRGSDRREPSLGRDGSVRGVGGVGALRQQHGRSRRRLERG